jgi:hypothetical protein
MENDEGYSYRCDKGQMTKRIFRSNHAFHYSVAGTSSINVTVRICRTIQRSVNIIRS